MASSRDPQDSDYAPYERSKSRTLQERAAYESSLSARRVRRVSVFAFTFAAILSLLFAGAIIFLVTEFLGARQLSARNEELSHQLMQAVERLSQQSVSLQEADDLKLRLEAACEKADKGTTARSLCDSVLATPQPTSPPSIP